MSCARILVLLAGWLALHAWVGASEVYQALVVSVVDGDTLWVRPVGQTTKRKLRLLGMDAPEICQPGGRDSRAALKAMVAGRSLRVTEYGRDSYGRSLVVLEADGLDIAARMVFAGHAWSAGSTGSKIAYNQEEREARIARRGLFSDDNAQHPGDFRKQHGSCYPPRKP